MIHRIHIRPFEIGLRFRRDAFVGLVEPGDHWLLGRDAVEIVDQRAPFLEHKQLDLIVRSGVLEGRALVLDLADHERGLLWVDGRFAGVLHPARYAIWTGFRTIRTEVIDARTVRFEHPERESI